jgi:DNA polymerase-3 subunit delta'
VIRIGQITHRDDSPPRVLLDAVNLKATESEFKMAVIVAADRMNDAAANSFLKTLEEPPAKSILILLSTEPQRLLETISSRCLRLSFCGEGARKADTTLLKWLGEFSEAASVERKSLLGRYNLMDVLVRQLAEVRERVEKSVTARSPLERYDDVEKELRDRWEDELKAAIEAEYRRQRADVLLALQWWLRDVWLHTLSASRELLHFPKVSGAEKVAGRINAQRARENLEIMENTQRLLHTNVQEALALEVGLLKLHL